MAESLRSKPNVFGSMITLGGTRCTIIDVIPAGSDYYPSKIQIWTIFYIGPNARRDKPSLHSDRVGPSLTATIAGAQSQMDTINARLLAGVSGDERRVVGTAERLTSPDDERRSHIPAVVARRSLFSLVGCVREYTVNLLLARATGRRKESR